VVLNSGLGPDQYQRANSVLKKPSCPLKFLEMSKKGEEKVKAAVMKPVYME